MLLMFELRSLCYHLTRESSILERSNRLFHALTSCQLYDYAITFVDEVNYVWKQSFSLVTLLFLLSRYLPFFDTFALSLCSYPSPKPPPDDLLLTIVHL